MHCGGVPSEHAKASKPDMMILLLLLGVIRWEGSSVANLHSWLTAEMLSESSKQALETAVLFKKQPLFLHVLLIEELPATFFLT